MKKVVLMLFLLASLTSCNKNQENIPEVEDERIDINLAFEVSQTLGDEAIAYYLGREVNEEYMAPLLNLAPISDDSQRIYFGPEVELSINNKLSEVAMQSMSLPGSPSYTAPALPEEGASGGDEASGGDQFPVEEGVLTELDAFKQLVFPDGIAPSIEALDDIGNITAEFKLWFFERMSDLDLIDSRIYFDYNNQTYVISGDCSPSKGGNVFKVFDEEYTIPQHLIGVTAEEALTSPTYQMVLETYRYFDDGTYQAVYVTDPNVGASETVRIRVDFTHHHLTEGDERDISVYLADIYNISVSID